MSEPSYLNPPFVLRGQARITIGVTTFDRFELLIETLNSIKSQSFTDFNVVIANDNPERILNLKMLGVADDQRFKIINHNRNLGEIETLNSLLRCAETEFFTWLSDDDLFHPLFLLQALQQLDLHPEANVFYSKYSYGRVWTDFERTFNVKGSIRLLDKEEFLLDYSSRRLKLIGCYGIFRREPLQGIGGFHQLGNGFSPYSDSLIPILLSNLGAIIFQESELVFLRVHPESLSHSATDFYSYSSAQKAMGSKLAHITNELSIALRERVHKDFFDWFSKDRAAVIQRGGRILRPSFMQIRSDLSFLHALKIYWPRKIQILVKVSFRLCKTLYLLTKVKMRHIHQ